MQPTNYGLSLTNPFDSLTRGASQWLSLRNSELTNQHNTLVNERMQDENAAYVAQQQRTMQMLKELDALDFNDANQLRQFTARYPKMSEGVQNHLAHLNAEEQRAMLSDLSLTTSALRNDQAELAYQHVLDKAVAYKNAGDEGKAQEYAQYAETIKNNPKTALRQLSAVQAFMMSKDQATAYKNMQEADIAVDKAPAEIEGLEATNKKINAETGKVEAETQGVKADTFEKTSNVLSAAALVKEPQLFMQKIDMAQRQGLVPEEHAKFFETLMELPHETAAAVLESYAKGNPEVAKLLMTDVLERYKSDNSLKGAKYSADLGYQGRVYSADKGFEGQVYNADSRERSNKLDNQTKQYTAQIQAEMQKYGIDVNAANAQQRLAFEKQQEAIKNNQGEIKEFNGKAYFVKKDGAVYQAFDKNGNELVPTSTSSKPLTEGQAKDKLFGTRMQKANEIINQLEADGTTRGSILSKAGDFGETAANILPSFMGGNSKEQQKYLQAQRDFINAVLRRESGAVIGEEEFENAKKQYFPQVGDSDAVIQQKRRNRELATQELLSNVPNRGASNNQPTKSLDISDLFKD